MDRMLGEFDRNRRNFCKTAFAGAIGCFALAQGYARAAIVHTDDSNLPPYGNATLPTGIRSRIVNNINGLAMHVLEAGFEPKGRPCVLLLHGFPELAYSWRRIMLPLAAAGYYVVAPDQRGYGRTTGWDDEYDGDVDSFRFPNVVRDALGLVSALGYRLRRGRGRTRLWLAGRGVLRSVEARRIPFSSIDECPVRRTAAAAVQYRGGRDAGPKRRRGARQSLRRPCEARAPTKRLPQYYRTREANDNMWKAPQGIHAFLRAYYHVKSADWKQNEPFKLASFTAGELAKIADLLHDGSRQGHGGNSGAGNAFRGRDCRLQVASGQGASRVRNGMESDRFSGRFAVV